MMSSILSKDFSELTITDWEFIKREIVYYQIDQVFNILTRQACDRFWDDVVDRESKSVIFLDLDFMHDLNATYGYSVVDEKIKSAMSEFRSHEICGRWYSGDEFILIAPTSEVKQVCDRLHTEFNAQGISITVGASPIRESNLKANVEIASKLVQDLKAHSQRGVSHIL